MSESSRTNQKSHEAGIDGIKFPSSRFRQLEATQSDGNADRKYNYHH